MKALEEEYRGVMLKYITKFCERHQLDFDERDQSPDWINHEVVFLDDWFVNFNDLRYDVDNDVPEGVYEDWYDMSVDCYELGVTFPNFPSFAKGAPHISSAGIEELIKARREIISLTQDLQTKIDEMNKSNS